MSKKAEFKYLQVYGSFRISLAMDRHLTDDEFTTLGRAINDGIRKAINEIAPGKYGRFGLENVSQSVKTKKVRRRAVMEVK